MNRTRVIIVVVAAIVVLGGVVGYIIFSGQSNNSNNTQNQQASSQFYTDRGGGTPIPQMRVANDNPPVTGTAQQVSDKQLIVNSDSGGTVTVTLATTGTVTRQDSGQLSDIHVGDTVTAVGDHQGVTMTVQALQIGGGDMAGGGPMMIQLNAPPPGSDSTGGSQTYDSKNSDSGQGSLAPGGRPVRGKVTQVGSNTLTIQTADGSSVTATLDGNTTIQKNTAIALADIQKGDHVVVSGQQSGASYQASNIMVLQDRTRLSHALALSVSTSTSTTATQGFGQKVVLVLMASKVRFSNLLLTVRQFTATG